MGLTQATFEQDYVFRLLQIQCSSLHSSTLAFTEQWWIKYSTSPKHWDTSSAFLSSLYPNLPSSQSSVRKAWFVQSFHAPCILEKFSICHSLIIYFKKSKLMGKNNPIQCTGWLGKIQIFARSFLTQTMPKWINYASQIQLQQKLSLEGVGALSIHQSSLAHLKITCLRNKYLQTGHSSMKQRKSGRQVLCSSTVKRSAWNCFWQTL